jgi:hypothetical protein
LETVKQEHNHEKECNTLLYKTKKFYTKPTLSNNETKQHFIPPLFHPLSPFLRYLMCSGGVSLIIEGLSYFESTSPSFRGTKSGGPTESGPVGTTEEVDEALLFTDSSETLLFTDSSEALLFTDSSEAESQVEIWRTSRELNSTNA